ncbi:MAG: tRNA (cytidine(34)-2'-O)-methyltransferase [Gammaproteobacteria bacterium]|nr:tRNA (cytidine(34)-2'-O)-methyltransferase [Gammaproteobacteria bacterium]
MFHLIAYQPEIPPNTGNMIRLCANSGATLHLIHPLGFELSESRVKRAGLDYHQMAHVIEHADLDSCLRSLGQPRLFALSTRGGEVYAQARFLPGDAFLLGPETRGLPQQLLDSVPPERRLRIPLMPDNRSLNLSNAAAIVLYEAWRQQGFAGSGQER